MENLIEVNDLQISLKTKSSSILVVENVSFSVKEGGALGIIGESGSGKSLTCQGIQGLLSSKNWDIKGTIMIDGEKFDLSDGRNMRDMRGDTMAMIMQNPVTAFDSVIKIGEHFKETINNRKGNKESDREIRKDVAALLERMRIRDPEAVLDSYSFQLSGGMLQRIMIALALVVKPKLLIADEPTTALDRTVEHEIIALLKELKNGYNMSLLIVSHDLSVIEDLVTDLAVMYAGRFVETGKMDMILSTPEHPYTEGLFKSRPAFLKERLPEMKGQPPTLEEGMNGCAFFPRCPLAQEYCSSECPSLVLRDDGRKLRCFRK